MAADDTIAAQADTETKVVPRKGTAARIAEDEGRLAAVEGEVSDAVKAAYGIPELDKRISALENASAQDGAAALAQLRADFEEFKAAVKADLGI
jgi:hypothetical protein